MSIEWKKNPGYCPVDKNTIVKYKLRSGVVYQSDPEYLDWTIYGDSRDILEYSVLVPETSYQQLLDRLVALEKRVAELESKQFTNVVVSPYVPTRTYKSNSQWIPNQTICENNTAS